jgi:uncharacterized protein (TIGR02757 family)
MQFNNNLTIISQFDTLKPYLDGLVTQFNRPEFIENDPIAIPHRFSSLQDIEITAFWTAMLAWGQRKTILKSANTLFALMDNAPHDFIVNHQEIDRKNFLHFKHRTFQPTDTLYFLEFFQQYYRSHASLETAFYVENGSMDAILKQFHTNFFALMDAPDRTRKHVSTPANHSACKRLNMFLRWMVRKDENGVDFGVWNALKPSQLVIPLDVHVERVARKLGLIQRPKPDWQTAMELTENLRLFDADDPVKYDFALFGLGVLKEDNELLGY